MSFDSASRFAALQALEPTDLLVIGGGITGAGVALDAAARGLSTVLVERADFASGTSSKSSKLVHGGLRYLRQYEFGLVAEALRERHHLLANAPHLVRLVPFLVPVIAAPGKRGTARAYARLMSAGLWAYDLLGRWSDTLRHKRIRPQRAVEMFPALDPDRVVSAYLYLDARTDDARLVLAVIQTAVRDFGAVAANYAEVVELLEEHGRVCGAMVRDRETGTIVTIRARAVVNAGGVWSDEVRALAGPHPHSIRPAKGVHITVPLDRLPISTAAVLQVTGDDRIIFVVPWDGRVYIGTTDTTYDGDIDDPRCNADDVQYLLDAVNACVSEPLTPADVVGTWAGLRPLITDPDADRTADLSRKHTTIVDESGLITITGGKLTTYRRMAADAVDAVVKALGVSPRPKSCTADLRLHGFEGYDTLAATPAEQLGVDSDLADHLVERYGGNARAVLSMMRDDPTLAEPLVRGLSYRRAEAVYAVRHEMAVTLDDVLSRRTRGLILDRDAALDAAAATAALIAPELGWDNARVQSEIATFTAIASDFDG